MKTDDARHERALLVGALGVVYGDIGTSPLYALRECFSGSHSAPVTEHNIYGVLSLIFWALILLVSLKYLGLMLRANNKGEGGILALLALGVPERELSGNRRRRGLLVLGVFGAALLYGDGMLTPAVTVLGAVEGLEVATPVFKPYVLPVAAAVLIALFSFQRLGTGRVGSVFGPIMVLWFLSLAVLGVREILLEPRILLALSPHYAGRFFAENGPVAFGVLGAVFLAVTGAEALYADMGHFGARPIRQAWFRVALPALLLNYLGQGALLLRMPDGARSPFYLLAPSWALYPLVGLATVAAVIASQALIAGAYSLTMQAVQIGFLPRLLVRHTSRSERGQIYMPQVNWMLMVACVALVLGFGSSSRLAGAYGIAVSLTMLVTTMLFFAAARRLWRWRAWQAGLVCGGFLLIEAVFAGANGLKLLQGGWVPLLVGLILCSVMLTWKWGREILRRRLFASWVPFEQFLKEVDASQARRVPGTAVFLSGNLQGTPLALLHNLKHNKVLHERVVVLTVVTEDIPHVPASGRLQVGRLRGDVFRVVGHYGFMEQPNVPELLRGCAAHQLEFDPMDTTFFVSRETILSPKTRGWSRWPRRLFAALSRNAQHATAFFQLPADRVVELGMQVEI